MKYRTSKPHQTGKNIYTETIARKFPAIHGEKTQNGHHRINTGSRNNTTRLVRKRSRNSRRLYMGDRSRSIIPDDTGGIQNRTRQNSGERPMRLFNEYFLPKRNIYHNRGEFFWTIQAESEIPEVFWRRLIEIEKECVFEGITTEDLLISKFITRTTDTKLRDKLLKEKKLELKKTIEIIKQNTYERKNQKNTIPEDLISNREKEIKEEPIQRVERSDTRPKKNKFTNKKQCKFCNARTHRIRTPPTNALHWENCAGNAERSDFSHVYVDKEKITNAKYAM